MDTPHKDRAKAEIERIEKGLKAANVTVEEFCEKAQLNRATWQRIKGGKQDPRLSTWLRIQKTFDFITAPSNKTDA